MGSADTGTKVLAGAAAGIGLTALILSLTKPAKAAAAGGAPVVDEEVRQALAAILSQQLDTLKEIEAIKLALGKIPVEGEAIMPLTIEQIPFAYNLAALQGVTLEETAPFDGYIKEVTVHWPPGCNALVDVRVGHGTKQFCPREGFLALDDTTVTYPFDIEVKMGDPIWAEMNNGDSGNPHNITVTVMVEGIT